MYKQTNPFKAFAVFAAIVLSMLFFGSCTTQQHGYNYKSHAKHRNTGPSKCFKKHNPEYNFK